MMLLKIPALLLFAALGLLVLWATAHPVGAALVVVGGLYALTKIDWSLPEPAQEAAEASPNAPAPAMDLATPVATAPGQERPQGLLRKLLDATPSKWVLPLIYGTRDGRLLTADLTKAPHVLVAGATGSGKSVFLNTLVQSLAAWATTDELRLCLIDPKRVELSQHAHLPHVAACVTEKREAESVLAGLCDEMDRRYGALQAVGKRDIGETANDRIVLVIDEFADLILPATSSSEDRKLAQRLRGYLSRLLALGRAAGIHVVLATQRPCAKVVDGLMKANVPTRVAFRVASKTQSRIILDQNGAEELKGKGDGMAVTADGTVIRFQGQMLESN